MNVTAEQYIQIDALRIRDEKIKSHLNAKAWTPALAAQLIYGIDPPCGVTEIGRGGISLDGKVLQPSDRCFRDAQRLLDIWMDGHDDDSEAHEKARREIDWTEFFTFFILEDFKTPWMCLILKLGNQNIPGWESTLPDAVSVLFSAVRPASIIETKNEKDFKKDSSIDIQKNLTTSSPAKKTNNIRWNPLRTPIENAILLAKGKKRPQDVYEVLKEAALRSEPPFTHADEGSLWYTDNNDCMQRFTLSMLAKRMRRYNEKK